MQLILREDVSHLGEVGDVVTVKPGFGRNYLLPRGMAIQANARQLNRLKHERRNIEVRVARARGEAETQAAKLNKVVLTIEKAAGENGKLFGSVTTMELQAMLAGLGHEVDRRTFQLEGHLKELGHYKVGIKLHRDVIAEIVVNVKPADAVVPEV